MKPRTLPIMAILTAGLAAACGSGGDSSETHPITPTGATESSGIVVESTTLESDPGGDFSFASCGVRGSVRNDTSTDRRVTLAFAPLNRSGNVIRDVLSGSGVATNDKGGELIVRAGARSKYRARLLEFQDCKFVEGVAITELKSEPVA